MSLVTLLAIGLNGCDSDSCNVSVEDNKSIKEYKMTAFYSDPMLERSLAIDLETMSIKKEIYSTGDNTYNVDILDENNTLNRVFVMTRGSNSIDVIDTKILENNTTIGLQHYPRSSAYNAVLGLMLISGKNKAMSSLIDVKSNEVVVTVGEDKLTTPSDYGGSNATGHPCWFSANQFGLLDREKRTVELFKIEKTNGAWRVISQDKIEMPSSVHHIIREGDSSSNMSGTTADFNTGINDFYAVIEGSHTNKIAPAVMKIRLKDDKLILGKKVDIGFDESVQKGIHHIIFHPKEELIYAPSKEGVLYVIDYKDMKVVSTIQTGKGSGHITFVPKRDLAIITNHADRFITIVDTKTNKKIKDIEVSDEAINGEMLQSHTQYVDKDENYFYAFATDNGVFYELDLAKLEINRTLYTGGTPKQGGFIKLFEF
jgi:YVTN family beta-propeller protein